MEEGCLCALCSLGEHIRELSVDDTVCFRSDFNCVWLHDLSKFASVGRKGRILKLLQLITPGHQLTVGRIEAGASAWFVCRQTTWSVGFTLLSCGSYYMEVKN
jgi:hypothetical protein